MSGAGVSLLIAHEIVSPVYYTRRLQGIACPGGSSGPTRGIGWDDGMQTRSRIAAAWAAHPQLERILPASGQTGRARCRAYRDANRDVRTPYALAESVFVDWALPDYHAQTARAFRNGFDALPQHAQDSLVMTVYNRGSGMNGARRAEMRTLRDVCVPAGDTACMAAQYRQMVRLWRGTDIEAGMRKRYEDTARLAEGGL
ncbi:hypothetical protein CO615_00010 [Lysobacteraceae bacterium NML75-0749]|nr:hypothetical protein CO615_00010 [Xanthomonadaceae bacterium NML75-0749]